MAEQKGNKLQAEKELEQVHSELLTHRWSGKTIQRIVLKSERRNSSGPAYRAIISIVFEDGTVWELRADKEREGRGGPERYLIRH